MKTRIEVDEMGRHVLIVPEDIVEEFQVDDGDIVELKLLSEDHTVEVYF